MNELKFKNDSTEDGNLSSTTSSPSWFKVILSCIIILFLLSACNPPYRAMNGYRTNEIGYSVVKVEEDVYHVAFQAYDNHSYDELKKSLNRYVSELCLTNFKLDEIIENQITFTAWDSQRRPRNQRAVTSLLYCEDINENLYKKSYRDVLWFLLDGLLDKS
jgi:hypothetical protein